MFSSQVLNDLFADNVVRVFFFAFVIIVGCALWKRQKSPESAAHWDTVMPGLLTTIGVVGTFVGIFIGLLDFDVENIDESVPALLSGLKLAFFTSILGMFLAVVWRTIVTFWPPIVSTNDEAQLFKLLEESRDASVGLREELVAEFQKFAENTIGKNSDAITKALKEVIEEFNVKLNEQFGENFVRLQEAMDKLLIWQDNYRTHIEQTEARLENAVNTIEKTEESLGQIVTEHLVKIPEHLGAFNSVVSALRRETDDLSEHLQALAGLKESALEAFPKIEDNIKQLTDGFSLKVQEATQEMVETSATQKRSFENLIAKFLELKNHINALGEGLQQSVESQRKSLDQSGRQLNDMLTSGLTGAQNSVQALVKTSIDEMKNLNKEQLSEIAQTFGNMGQELASVSVKLAENWESVAKALDSNGADGFAEDTQQRIE